MTSLTLITLAVVVFGIVNARGYGRALALGAATPVGAWATWRRKWSPTPHPTPT